MKGTGSGAKHLVPADPHPRKVVSAELGPLGVAIVNNDCQIRLAATGEADLLSELAIRSKAYWGYPEQFMNMCREELSVDEGLIQNHRVFVFEEDKRILGFYSLENLPSGQVELGHLFVEPERIGDGIGSQLLRHGCRSALDLGFRRLVIQGDPNAEIFYLRCGAIRFGDRESASVPGRTLPLFELDLCSDRKP